MKTCRLCDVKMSNWVRVNGKRHNIQNRSCCLSCIPFGQAIPRKRTSKLWTIPKDELEQLVQSATTLTDVFTALKIKAGGQMYYEVQKRLESDNICTKHLKGKSHGRLGVRFAVSLTEALVENSTYPRKDVKQRLLKEGLLENRCSICGQLPEWFGKPLTLDLDHINGVHNDNRLENLRILCPNCHRQTKTWGGKNKRDRS